MHMPFRFSNPAPEIWAPMVPKDLLYRYAVLVELYECLESVIQIIHNSVLFRRCICVDPTDISTILSIC